MAEDAATEGADRFLMEDPLRQQDDAGEGVEMMPSVPLEEHQALARRLHRSEELIRQLKHIVKAQHGKIEEFREKLEISSIGKSPFIATYEAEDFVKAKQDNEELRKRLNLAQAELVKVKADNTTLKKVNRRLKGLLQGDDQSPGGSLLLPDLMSTMQSTAQSGYGSESWPPASATMSSTGPLQLPSTAPALSARSPRLLGTSPLTSRGSARKLTEQLDFNMSLSDQEQSSASVSPSKKQMKDKDAAKSLPPFSRVSRLINSLGLLWRDPESPLALLRALADVSSRLLADRQVSNVTVFVVDPWLRKAITSGPLAPKAVNEQPVIFYLGQGKTELQALSGSDIGAKVLAPAFSDMQALPCRTRTFIAHPVHTPNRARIWAVLQVYLEDAKVADTNASFVPKVLQDAGVSKDAGATKPLSFTDSHVNFLQLLCGLVGGVLVYIEKLEQRAKLVDRTRAVMEVAINVNKAKTLADFEQRVKHLFSGFFSVNTIRVIFYDPETGNLMISSSQMRRKGAVSIPVTKGILGQCAMKRQVVNVPDISQNPYVDPIVDGLQRSGRPVGTNASMLVGPMLVDSTREEKGGDLVGLVQLLEKKRRNQQDGSTQSSDFTVDEQTLFQQLLVVCSHAGSRTIKVQQLSAQLNGVDANLYALLSAA
eukprot:gb/GFBE01077313.1/.p1 GENE.gb/GFBE01077313.1/~~gb/GFBE01077313.1/.p1  ORF type:complete len:654 (+),score=142.17 gb/GFBE01077313.1/:1-1962(+)